MIWTDICNSILPLTEKKATDQALARKGRKGWGSDATKEFSANLRGKKEALKQKSWDTVRVWWQPILTRGKLHIVTHGTDFPGECPAAAPLIVRKVRAALNVRFPADQPKVLFVDRGKGFFDPATGVITTEYKEAAREANLKVFQGDDASIQPGQANLGQLLLHETAVSWVRYRLARTLPAKAWEESVDEFGTRLRSIAHDINSQLNVEGLCKEFPSRVEAVLEQGGDNIAK